MGRVITADQWVYAIEEKQLQNDVIHVVFPAGLPVALIRKPDAIFAISNKCAHMGCALSAGIIKGYILKCPCHDWRYDIRTGEFFNAKEVRIPIYPVRAEDGKVYINITGAKL